MNLLLTVLCGLTMQTAPDLSQDDWRMYRIFALAYEETRKEVGLTNWQYIRFENDLVRYSKAFPQTDFMVADPAALNERLKRANDAVHDLHDRFIAVMLPSQRLRLRQISLQMNGPMAVFYPNIAKELGITEDQMTKFKEIHEEQGEAYKNLSTQFMTKQQEVARLGPRAIEEAGRDHQKNFMAIQQLYGDKILKQFTPAQRARWKEMLGKPYTPPTTAVITK